jgi:hypothetical protein
MSRQRMASSLAVTTSERATTVSTRDSACAGRTLDDICQSISKVYVAEPFSSSSANAVAVAVLRCCSRRGGIR